MGLPSRTGYASARVKSPGRPPVPTPHRSASSAAVPRARNAGRPPAKAAQQVATVGDSRSVRPHSTPCSAAVRQAGAAVLPDTQRRQEEAHQGGGRIGLRPIALDVRGQRANVERLPGSRRSTPVRRRSPRQTASHGSRAQRRAETAQVSRHLTTSAATPGAEGAENHAQENRVDRRRQRGRARWAPRRDRPVRRGRRTPWRSSPFPCAATRESGR